MEIPSLRVQRRSSIETWHIARDCIGPSNLFAHCMRVNGLIVRRPREPTRLFIDARLLADKTCFLFIPRLYGRRAPVEDGNSGWRSTESRARGRLTHCGQLSVWGTTKAESRRRVYGRATVNRRGRESRERKKELRERKKEREIAKKTRNKHLLRSARVRAVRVFN